MAKINDKGVYPPKSPISAGDYVVGTDSTSTSPDNQTKNFLMSDIKTFVNSGSGVVTSVTSTNPAITVAGTTTPALTSTEYAGGATIGHVPPDGTAATYLKGDGSWGTPVVTSSILYSNYTDTQVLASSGSVEKILFADVAASNLDVTIATDGSITFLNTGLYIVEFFGNFIGGDGSNSQVIFQPFLDSVGVRNVVAIDLPTTPDIFRPFTRTDVFQVPEANQVLKYEAGHLIGTLGSLRSINASALGFNDPVPSASITVSRIKI